MFRLAVAAAAVLLGSTVAVAGDNPTTENPATAEPVICKKVVTAEPGTKPFDMCMTKAQWAAKKKADAKDPNRIVCKYEDSTGNRLKAYKICMTAAEWWNQRQRERANIERIQNGVCVKGGGC